MKRILTTIMMTCIAVVMTNALTIEVAPGELYKSLPALRNNAESTLKLNGKADVRDLVLLKNISSATTTVDLSNLEIIAYTYATDGYMGKKSFVAGELPANMLAGTKINAFAFPSNISIIGESAFSATQLVSSVIPASVTKIGDYAFAGSVKLQNIKFEGTPEMGCGIFKNCSALSNIDFTDGITSISDYMFDGAAGYAQSVPANVTRIGAYAYRGTALNSLDLKKVKSIGDYAFSSMPNLVDVEFSNTTNVEFGVGVFSNDPILENVIGVKGDISDMIFSSSPNASVNNVLNSDIIGEGALANNVATDSIVFGSNVREIKAHAFRNMTNLKAVNVSGLGKEIPLTDSDAFSGLENSEGRYDISLYVHKGDESVWKEDPLWSKMNLELTTDIGNITITDIDAKLGIEKIGDSLNITSSNPIESVVIYSTSGVILYQAAPMTNTYTISLPTTEVIVVKVISGNMTKIAKLAK